MKTEEILEEREKTHGSFKNYAETVSEIETAIGNRIKANKSDLTVVQKESLHMIVRKIARILNGKPDHKDHWDDIAGYAVLSSRSLDDKLQS